MIRTDFIYNVVTSDFGSQYVLTPRGGGSANDVILNRMAKFDVEVSTYYIYPVKILKLGALATGASVASQGDTIITI